MLVSRSMNFLVSNLRVSCHENIVFSHYFSLSLSLQKLLPSEIPVGRVQPNVNDLIFMETTKPGALKEIVIFTIPVHMPYGGNPVTL